MKLADERIVRQAYEIAARSLKRCYDEKGILAGRHQFEDYWARDSMFASLGALRLSDTEIVRKSLDLYLGWQKADGQLPYKVGANGGMILRWLGWHSKRKDVPVYKLPWWLYWGSWRVTEDSLPRDANDLVVIAAARYWEVMGSRGWLVSRLEKLERALEWNEKWLSGGLIYEGWHANWADSLRIKGFGLYTNVVHWKAMGEMAKMWAALGDGHNAGFWRRRQMEMGREIKYRLWNGSFFDGWEGDRGEHLVTDGNMLAIWWNLTDREEARSIWNAFRGSGVFSPVPAENNYPRYDGGVVPTRLRLTGLSGYHNATMGWLWLGAAAALAIGKLDREAAEDLLVKMARVIVKYGEVYEVYDQRGQPARGFLYQAEHPFAWSAGMFVESAAELLKSP